MIRLVLSTEGWRKEDSLENEYLSLGHVWNQLKCRITRVLLWGEPRVRHCKIWAVQPEKPRKRNFFFGRPLNWWVLQGDKITKKQQILRCSVWKIGLWIAEPVNGNYDDSHGMIHRAQRQWFLVHFQGLPPLFVVVRIKIKWEPFCPNLYCECHSGMDDINQNLFSPAEFKLKSIN